MALIDDNEIELIRSKANIVNIIGDFIPLTLKGKNYFGVCPFHEDHSPSMSVSTDKQIYKCFSCGAAGNVFTFIQNYENISFLEAVKFVADKIGYNLNISINTKEEKNDVSYEIMKYAVMFYENYLNTKDGVNARKYLNDRGLSNEIIKEFNIGLAPYKKDSLGLILTKKYDSKLLKDLSLINVDGANVYDSFVDRIMFPIHDLDGNPIAFTGRVYSKYSDAAKYFNSRESKIFKKGLIFYNYHRAISYIKQYKEVIIVEGNMDAIRLYSEGIKNVIALMGTSLTKNQIDIIKKLRSKVILMLDNDDAGETATINNGKLLEESGISPFAVRLSDYKDPDEYILKNGVDAMRQNIKDALSFWEFKLFYYKKNKNLSNTTDLINYLREILKSIPDMQDDLTKEITLKKLADEYDISIDILKKELKNKSIKDVKTTEKVVIPKKNKFVLLLDRIIYYMINDVKYIIKFEKHNIFVEDNNYRNLIQEIKYYNQKFGVISPAAFLSYMANNELFSLLSNIVSSIDEELFEDNFDKYLIDLTKTINEVKIKQLKEELKTTLDVNKKVALAAKIIELKKEV